jgi:hypothetical protein
MLQVLNVLTAEYEFQILLLEKCLENEENLLLIEELKKKLNLRFERNLSKKDA